MSNEFSLKLKRLCSMCICPFEIYPRSFCIYTDRKYTK